MEKTFTAEHNFHTSYIFHYNRVGHAVSTEVRVNGRPLYMCFYCKFSLLCHSIPASWMKVSDMYTETEKNKLFIVFVICEKHVHKERQSDIYHVFQPTYSEGVAI